LGPPIIVCTRPYPEKEWADGTCRNQTWTVQETVGQDLNLQKEDVTIKKKDWVDSFYMET
ncbi:hypothetical protein M9458_005960, partial [Cirrhinus mrigala]